MRSADLGIVATMFLFRTAVTRAWPRRCADGGRAGDFVLCTPPAWSSCLRLRASARSGRRSRPRQTRSESRHHDESDERKPKILDVPWA